MSKWMVQVLQVVLGASIAGSLFIQAVMIPFVARDMDGADQKVLDLRTPLLTIIVLGIVTAQIVMVCVWRLLTRVRRGTVFSNAAFRYVDIIIGAIAAASGLIFVLCVVLAPQPVPPEIVLLIGGLGVVIAGVALLVLVMRTLLAQAVALDLQAKHLQSELNEVI